MKIAIFIAIGALLAYIDVWYAQTIYRTLFCSNQLPEVVAPFRFVGATDNDGARGQSLAVMLSARLGALQYEFVTALHALQTVRQADATASHQTASKGPSKLEARPSNGNGDDASHPPNIADERNTPALLERPKEAQPQQLNFGVVDIPKLELKVSGVDFSGLFAWAYRMVAESRAIRVTVNCPANATAYDAAVDLETTGLNEIWLTGIEAKDIAVVNEVALAVLQKQSIETKSIPQAAGLDRSEFGKLIAALVEVAELNEKVQNQAVPTNAEYTKVVADLETILARTPNWPDLLELTAGAAENSRDLAKSLQLYQRSRAIVGETDKARQLRLTSTIARLDSQLKTVSQVRRILALLEIPPDIPVADSARKVRVGVLGGIPLQEQLNSLDKDVEKLDGFNPGDTGQALREHVGKVASVIRLIAPNTVLVFAPMNSDGNGFVGTSDVLHGLDQFAGSNLDVLVTPLGLGTGNSVAMSRVLHTIAKKTVVVLPAGNDGPKSDAQFAGILPRDEVMVVGAVDKDGKRADFSSGKVGDSILWAPGVNIPVHVLSHGVIANQFESGTSYAAAVGGAAAAIVLSKVQVDEPKKLITAFQETSKSAGTGEPNLIQVESTLQKLAGSAPAVKEGEAQHP